MSFDSETSLSGAAIKYRVVVFHSGLPVGEKFNSKRQQHRAVVYPTSRAIHISNGASTLLLEET